MKAVWLERCFYIDGASSPACGKFLKLMQRPLRQFVTTAWKTSLYRTCSSHRFAQMAAICVTNCHNLWRCKKKKNSQMSGWLLPQGCKAYKEFPAFPAACNYSRSDKVTWYRPRGQLLCRVCVGDRNPHLCLLLYCMKLHRLSAVLYTSHLNETNECYSFPPYTVAAGTGCVFHFLTWTPFNAFLHLVLRLPSLGKTETWQRGNQLSPHEGFFQRNQED